MGVFKSDNVLGTKGDETYISFLMILSSLPFSLKSMFWQNFHKYISFFAIGLHLLFEIKFKAGTTNIIFCIQQSASIWCTSFTKLVNNGRCGVAPRACFNSLSQNKLKNMLLAPLRNAHYSPVVWSWCTRYCQIAGCKKK